MLPPITSKEQMYRLLRAGLLGHTLPSAETPAQARELTAAGGHFAVRSKLAGGPCVYWLGAEAALEAALALPRGTWNLSPMLEDRHRVCYGHAVEAPHFRLHFTRDKKAARLLGDCNEERLDGLAARFYLQGVMDQRGWDTLLDLLECYPGHIVEFTVMAARHAAWGDSNTVFWEVRCPTGQYERASWRHDEPARTRPLEGD
jgi:hypothetical protein